MTLRLDHVGIAVWDLRPAVRLWSELLGGRYMQGAVDYAGFSFLQLEYAGGSRVELLTPASDREGFLVRFLRRRGEGVHHLTFVSDDLPAEVARLPVAPGNSDLCFQWDGPIADAVSHLERCRIPIDAGPMERFGARGPGTSVYFRDPDGSLLEFISYHPKGGDRS